MTTRSVNDVASWNKRFSATGGWEQNDGRSQTKIFAEYLCMHTKLDKNSKLRILDFGCALGDSIPVLHRHFPNATLFGTDLSHTAITRCQEQYGALATFFLTETPSLSDGFDAIIVSNVLEHLIDADQYVVDLLNKTTYLSIMVPYNETKKGFPLDQNSGGEHIRSFNDNSFDFVEQSELARKINQKVFSCPGAWGWPEKKRFKRELVNKMRAFVGIRKMCEPLQLLVEFQRV